MLGLDGRRFFHEGKFLFNILFAGANVDELFRDLSPLRCMPLRSEQQAFFPDLPAMPAFGLSLLPTA